MSLQEVLKALEQPIRIYLSPDGTVTIDWPIGRPVDRATCEHVVKLIAEHRKSPSANGNSQKGNTTENGGVREHFDYTASITESQGGI